jgi:hypothetical protein
MYLDCCGLVRKALRDLREDFGFDVGRWNQAYQYDTLPDEIEEKDMKPGDLVFISGTYFNPKVSLDWKAAGLKDWEEGRGGRGGAKREAPFVKLRLNPSICQRLQLKKLKAQAQKHDIVHVEIWMGDGEKTLGARHQHGVVQVHDSYRFVSKTYHSMQYHFRSIKPWLQGRCERWVISSRLAHTFNACGSVSHPPSSRPFTVCHTAIVLSMPGKCPAPTVVASIPYLRWRMLTRMGTKVLAAAMMTSILKTQRTVVWTSQVKSRWGI